MRQAFGERLHRRLADVVSGVAWRLRNPLLGPGVDHDAGPPAVDHRWDEGMDTVEHAHQVDPDHAIPDVGAGERVGATCNGSVVHEHRYRAKAPYDIVSERGDGRAVPHVKDETGGTTANPGRSLGHGSIAVDQTDAQPALAKSLCGRQANPTGGTRHDRDVACAKSFHSIVSLQFDWTSRCRSLYPCWRPTKAPKGGRRRGRLRHRHMGQGGTEQSTCAAGPGNIQPRR